MGLLHGEKLDHSTIARFRSDYLSEALENLYFGYNVN